MYVCVCVCVHHSVFSWLDATATLLFLQCGTEATYQEQPLFQEQYLFLPVLSSHMNTNGWVCNYRQILESKMWFLHDPHYSNNTIVYKYYRHHWSALRLILTAINGEWLPFCSLGWLSQPLTGRGYYSWAASNHENTIFFVVALNGKDAYRHDFLRDGQQSTLHSGHGSPSTRVNMNYALDVFPGLVNGWVNDIASLIDP